MSNQSTTPRHSLPSWFIAYQNTVGLGSLVASLMIINGVVYGSGVVQSIENPGSWGIFGTVMFVAFFVAGTSMPGLAIRYGEHIMHGSIFVRFASLVGTLLFFANEVWVSVTERSVDTVTTPADRWLLQLLHTGSLPFSPTVLAISLSLSIAVIGWAIVAGPPPVVDHASIEAKEQAKLIRAQYAAQRRQVTLASLGASANAFRTNLKGEAAPALVPASYQPEDDGDDGDDDDTYDGGDDDDGTDVNADIDGNLGAIHLPDASYRPVGARLASTQVGVPGQRAMNSQTLRASARSLVTQVG